MSEAKRVRVAVTAELERRALVAMAHRLPVWVTSDRLTILGVLGALGVGAGFALSNLSPHWLWLASAALVVNWFGDSLDGTVARVRRAERPKYGYYLDHAVDAFTTVVIGVGIGLSPYVPLIIGLLFVAMYLMMSVNVYLESATFGEFRMDYGWLGPTEVRALLIVGNTLLIAFDTLGGLTPEAILPMATWGSALLLAGMALLLAVRFGKNLVALGRLEPPRQTAKDLSSSATEAAAAEAAASANATATH
jgi:archaetidylinositol phosphate synthase